MNNLVIILLLFALVVTALMMLVQFVMRRRQALQRMHMRLLELQPDFDAQMQQVLIGRGRQQGNWWLEYWRRLYLQSGVNWTVMQGLVRVLGVFMLLLLLLTSWLEDWFSCLLLSAMLSLLTCWWWLARQRKARQKTFVLALPDAIGIIVRSLQAGHPLPEGLHTVADEMSGAIALEFAYMNERVSLGAAAEQALLRMYDHVGAEEIRLLSITVSVQAGTGGNLAEVLGKLADLIRQRSMLQMKIKAISAEGRFSAMVMAVFPFLLFALLSVLSPSYFDVLWQSGYGWHMVASALTLIGMGVMWLVRLVNMDL